MIYVNLPKLEKHLGIQKVGWGGADRGSNRKK